MEKVVYGVVDGFFFAVYSVFIGVKRQGSDGFRQDSDAGVDRSGLQRCLLVDSLAARACTEEKAVGIASEAILRTGSCGEKS